MFKLFFSRAAAGIATAGLTGTVAGFIILLYQLFTGAPSDGETFLALSTIYGAMIGAPFGILVVCLSRAKDAPWRALPTLLTGTSIGIVVLGLPWALLPGTNDPTILYVMCIAGPTIGGIVASGFIRGQGQSQRLDTDGT
jgi:hypothetical protein